ncbi:MAG: lipocalin-like domain-containing protein [Bacteroidales bacterium]
MKKIPLRKAELMRNLGISKGIWRKINSLISLLVILTACSGNSKITKESQLAGMYKLYISEMQDSTGVWREDPWTKGGNGYIIYDGIGHGALQITPKGYEDYEWLNEKESINKEKVKQKIDNMTVDELKSAVLEFSSFYAYVASYAVADTAQIVQHQRISSSIPVVWGTTVKRSFAFSGDTLILQVVNGNRRLKWIRMR